MAKTVSVIIPAYNAERFIREAIFSIANQTYRFFEVIVVDDASPDKTSDVVNELMKRYEWLHYIKLEKNSGQSYARNEGIRISSGDYIMFLDADDTYECNMLEKMVSAVGDQEKSIAICSFYRRKNGEVFSTNIRLEAGRMDINSFLGKVFSVIPLNYLSCIGTKIYRRDILEKNNIWFTDKYKHNEDLGIVIDYFKYINEVVVIPEELYCYNYVAGSSQHKRKYREGALQTIGFTREEFAKLLKTYDVFNETEFAKSMIDMYFGNLLCDWSSFSEFLDVYQYLENNDYYFLKCKDCNQGILKNIFKWNYINRHRFLQYRFIKLLFRARKL